LSNFDGVVLQLDADVATFAYSHLGLPLTDAEALASGWLPLPCPTACPPAPLPQDALFSVLLSWLSPATPGAKTVVCIPAMNTGAWQAAANPRFWRTDYLYKIQTSCQATGKKEDSTDEFFKLFLPELRKQMRQIDG
jgi:hypothetical protein